MEIKYQHYGSGRGMFYTSEFLDKYNKEIDEEFTIMYMTPFDNKTIKDIEATLKKSLDNGKDFYSNAPDYIKRQMEEYEKRLEEGYKL